MSEKKGLTESALRRMVLEHILDFSVYKKFVNEHFMSDSANLLITSTKKALQEQQEMEDAPPEVDVYVRSLTSGTVIYEAVATNRFLFYNSTEAKWGYSKGLKIGNKTYQLSSTKVIFPSGSLKSSSD